uniref:Prostaglandin E2 receptor EP2 subtype n=1 Tax=Pogona vitticeps TaxID=103695 RepID=A0ABM5FC61_9SAUR
MAMPEAASAGPSPSPPPWDCQAAEHLRWQPGESAAISAVMFAAGVLGNAAALGLLAVARRRGRRRGRPAGPFHVLLLALVLTDLLGTCLLSPAVLAAYGRGRTLVALAEGGRACRAFAFAMSFFGLATMGCLGAMALERSLALGAPYLYARLLGARRCAPALLAAAVLPALAVLAAAFCALPLLGFGRYVQYCPGTWCFIEMRSAAQARGSGPPGALAFSLLYASLLLLLILAVLLCNLSVIVNLVRMHRRAQATRRLAAGPAAPSPSPAGPPREAFPERPAPGPRSARRRPLSVSEELDHLILLSIMTLTFAVCSLPFTIRAFMDYFSLNGDYKGDLLAMRFLSINSIIDPWVFVILRPSVLRLVRSVLCCQMPFKMPWAQKQQRPSLAVPRSIPEADVLDRGSPAFGQR